MADSDRQSGVDRRSLLLASGGAVAAGATRAGAGTEGMPPMTPEAYLARFNAVERIPLWPGRAPGGEGFTGQTHPTPGSPPSPTRLHDILMPALHVFPSPKPSGRGLLVIPGGSYGIVSVGAEGVDVADHFNAAGMTVFVLTYRLPGEGWARRYDVPLQDAQRAMRLIRSQAARFGVDPQTLAVLGFSAGGHLAASLTTDWAGKVYDAIDAADELSARPYASALLYPVIDMEPPFAHRLSRENLLGPDPSAELVVRRSPARHVGPDTPPVFLAHALDDESVHPYNSLQVLTAMHEHKRPVEAHFFQEGHHAFGLGRPGTSSAHWPDLYLSWLARLPAAT